MSPDHGISRMMEHLADFDVSASRISKWSVGMHLHHCCRSTIGICKALAASEEPVPPRGFNPKREVLLRTGWIPRGRAKAPDIAMPSDAITREEVEELLAKAREHLSAATELPPTRWFRHFILGVLDRDDSLRFIDVHNRHHLKIVARILTAR